MAKRRKRLRKSDSDGGDREDVGGRKEGRRERRFE